jgi:hypothetical protein
MTQVALSRVELVIIATALASTIDEYNDNEDEKKVYQKISDILERDDGR